MGIYPLSPDEKYGHDVYLIGNLLIDNKVDSVVLINGADDICKPCKYLKNGICVDIVNIGGFNKKHDYNFFIDQSILRHFEFNDGVIYEIDALLASIIQKAALDIFCKVWCFNNDNESRFNDTIAGIKKLIK